MSFFCENWLRFIGFLCVGVRCARITRFIDREYYLRFVSFLLGRPMCFPVGDSMNGPRADPPSLHLNQLAPSRAYSPRPPTVASQNGRFHLFGTRCPHSQHTHTHTKSDHLSLTHFRSNDPDRSPTQWQRGAWPVPAGGTFCDTLASNSWTRFVCFTCKRSETSASCAKKSV